MNDHAMFDHTSAAFSRRDLIKGGALIVGFAMAGVRQSPRPQPTRLQVRPIRAGSTAGSPYIRTTPPPCSSANAS
jgi:hypothetical protein